MCIGHLCDLQGLFSEIDNQSRVYRKQLQLMSMWCHDVVMLHRDGCLRHEVVTSHGDGCLETWKKMSQTPVNHTGLNSAHMMGAILDFSCAFRKEKQYHYKRCSIWHSTIKGIMHVSKHFLLIKYAREIVISFFKWLRHNCSNIINQCKVFRHIYDTFYSVVPC